MKLHRVSAFVFILLSLVTGCISGSSVPERINTPLTITLTPIDPFQGEAAKLKPFLGNMTGAFTLRYEGTKPKANLDIEIWNYGKKVKFIGGLGDIFFTPNKEERKEIELIISIDTVAGLGQDNMNHMKIGIVHESGTGLYGFSTPTDQKMMGRGIISYYEPQSFIAQGTVRVWGMQMTSANRMITADFSQELLSKVEQAILFTLRFDD